VTGGCVDVAVVAGGRFRLTQGRVLALHLFEVLRGGCPGIRGPIAATSEGVEFAHLLKTPFGMLPGELSVTNRVGAVSHDSALPVGFECPASREGGLVGCKLFLVFVHHAGQAFEAGVETLARRAQAAPAGSFAGETVDLGAVLLSAAASA
jgi:hypothetical protein